MLPQSHALSGLRVEDGFKIKEPVLVPGLSVPTGTVAMMPAAASSFKAQPMKPQEFRPIREVIPFTEGRALGWKLRDHCMSAKARNWPGVKPWEFKGQSVAICGGGPSLGHNLHTVRALQKRGTRVLAINRTHDFLLNLPKTHNLPWVKPWAGILLEPTPNAAGYMTPTARVRYYISSQCCPETFDKFEASEHIIWHASAKPELAACLTPDELKVMVPAVGSTCGIRAYVLMYMMGFTDIHLFGFDSCYRTSDIENGILGSDSAPKLHAYPKPETIHDMKEMMVKGFPEGDRKYFGNGNMLAQADEFQRLMEWRKSMIADGHMDPHDLTVHGDGLIPDIAREYGHHTDKRTS